MFKNLEAELVRNNISKEAVAQLIGKSYKSVTQKINGKYPFTIGEAFLIRHDMFPKLTMDYLFEGWDDPKSNKSNSDTGA